MVSQTQNLPFSCLRTMYLVMMRAPLLRSRSFLVRPTLRRGPFSRLNDRDYIGDAPNVIGHARGRCQGNAQRLMDAARGQRREGSCLRLGASHQLGGRLAFIYEASSVANKS